MQLLTLAMLLTEAEMTESYKLCNFFLQPPARLLMVWLMLHGLAYFCPLNLEKKKSWKWFNCFSIVWFEALSYLNSQLFYFI